MWQKLMLLAVTGAVGTLARYGLQGLVQRWFSSSFPWGTLAVNLVGCLAFGFVWALAEERMIISGQARTIILVGFMGAFTTFSTFAFESAELLRDAEWWLTIGNVFSHVVLGISFVFIGIAVGRWF